MDYTIWPSSTTSNTIVGNHRMYSVASTASTIYIVPPASSEITYGGYVGPDTRPYSSVDSAISGLLGAMMNEGCKVDEIIKVSENLNAATQLCVEYVYRTANCHYSPVPELHEYIQMTRKSIITYMVGWINSYSAVVAFTKYNMKVITDDVYIYMYHNIIKSVLGERTAMNVCEIQAPSKYLELYDSSSLEEDII